MSATNAKILYAYFLTAAIVAIAFVLLLRPINLTAEAKSILEMLLGGLMTMLMGVVHVVFPSTANPTQPATPAPGESK